MNTHVLKQLYVQGVMQEITDVLESCPPKNHKDVNGDGRINSIRDEEIISDHIIEHLGSDVYKGKHRDLGDLWIDLSIFGTKDDRFPINIKSVNISNNKNQRNNLVGLVRFIRYTYDAKNCNDKIGVAVTVAGENNQILNKYGLVLVSKNTPECWVGTIDQLPDASIHVNPSNDIQFSWPTHKIYRTNSEYNDLLQNTVKKLFVKMAEPLKVLNAILNK